MKVLVAYLTRTNNTGKIAKAIFEEIKTDKEIKKLDELENLNGYDIIFFGFPIENFGPSNNVKEFLEKNSSNKRIALFVTHGSPEFSDYLTPWLEQCRDSLDNSAEFLGLSNYQGEVAQMVIDSLNKSENPTLRYFAQESPKSKGQPDEKRIERAKEFAREIMKKVS
ncbi:MAG: flavodoxin [Asgard group archaeon]|nr:flavodoxin [Asgard group archaeon]